MSEASDATTGAWLKPGTLPRGWASTTLGDVCLRISKVDPRQEPDLEFTYIDIGGIDSLRIAETKRLAGRDAPSRARQLVRAGDTVLSTVRTYLRKTALVPPELDGAVASTGFCVLRPGEALDYRYVFHRVTAHDFVSQITPLQTGSSYPAVRDRDVLAQEIELPPLNEQRRIVAAIEEHLSRLDAADASLAAALRRLDALASQTIAQAVNGDWEIALLREVTESQVYGTSAKAGTEPDGVPVLRMGNINGGKLDLSHLKYLPAEHPDVAKLTLELGDLLFNRTNSPELVGKSAVFTAHERMTFASYLIRVRLTERCDPHWAALVINGPPGRRYIASVRSQQVGQANVNGSKLAALPVPLPPLEEQRRIVQEVEERLSRIDAMRASIERSQRRSKALRAAILERAFRGELVPQDPSDEPAEALLARIRAGRESIPVRAGRGRKSG